MSVLRQSDYVKNATSTRKTGKLLFDSKNPLSILRELLCNRAYYWYTAALVLIGDACLTQLVIRYVPYTEIDFATYMSQIEVYNSGERRYSLIHGPSGPLVYPAGHVLIHRLLHYLTDGGKNQRLSQQIYAGIYTANQFLYMALFDLAGGVPNWVLPVVALSKRLHSIYVLRLFNDCWAVFFVLLSFICHCKRSYFAAAVLYSVSLSVKMNILLYLPGIFLILVKDAGILCTFKYIATALAVQIVVAKPFLERYPREYVSHAFDLSRVFLFKWTVNWRFFPEETFLSKSFANVLLISHLVTLVLFASYKWCADDGGAISILKRALRGPSRGGASAESSRNEIVIILFTTNLIGLIFARSLHYQFYAWYAQQIPFLLWRSKLPSVVRFMLLGTIEYAWNVFPSTNTSSAVLLTSHLLLLIGVWLGYPSRKDGQRRRVRQTFVLPKKFSLRS
ncbi:mannosyltransferase [Cantharellus anzutake]|uniref:mannosyltransferase n=1 Tax=Cantharellus anzutake TaxID=1750568 RepID=UPI001902F4D0|nr:mannosyltransferase [Cantharellus anzutake]KAF8335420.1 mannosyltransferase [Cantharellus anzutake]